MAIAGILNFFVQFRKLHENKKRKQANSQLLSHCHFFPLKSDGESPSEVESNYSAMQSGHNLLLDTQTI